MEVAINCPPETGTKLEEHYSICGILCMMLKLVFGLSMTCAEVTLIMYKVREAQCTKITCVFCFVCLFSLFIRKITYHDRTKMLYRHHKLDHYFPRRLCHTYGHSQVLSSHQIYIRTYCPFANRRKCSCDCYRECDSYLLSYLVNLFAAEFLLTYFLLESILYILEL